MGYTVRKRIKRSIFRYLLTKVYRDLLEEEFGRRTIYSVKNYIGPFDEVALYDHLAVVSPSSESGIVRGELVHALQKIAKPQQTLLLAGERNVAKPIYSQIARIASEQIVTAGLHDDMDYSWNYEQPPPKMPAFDIVISQAMLEHLVDPYRHVCDCYSLLKPGGTMILHTVMPGFKYHRFPVDCFRFYPDWFEEVAKRLGGTVSYRYLGRQTHIAYCICKATRQTASA